MARPAEARGLLRLPVRVERPRDVFNPSVLSARLLPGRRILLNATPADGQSAPICDRPEYAECNAPPNWAVITRHLLTPLELTSLRRSRTNTNRPNETFRPSMAKAARAPAVLPERSTQSHELLGFRANCRAIRSNPGGKDRLAVGCGSFSVAFATLATARKGVSRLGLRFGYRFAKNPRSFPKS
jgi:hypothetical protein